MQRQGIALLAQHRNTRLAGDNGAVRELAAGLQADPLHLLCVKLQDGRREDIVGNEDRRRAKLRQRFIALVKVTQRAVQNIFNINIARLQVSIVEMAILLA